MKACVSSLMPYLAAVPDGPLPEDPRGPWPTSGDMFDPVLSVRSVQAELDFLEMADHLGFDWVAVTEHHYLPRLAPAPVALVGALSQRIRRAKVAILGMTLPILNPVRAAEEYALLDNLLEGRLVAGVLRGTPPEHVAYGVDARDTRALYEEGVELLLRAWTEPRPFGWEGQYYRFSTVSIWPRPVQQPHPPLLVSGKSRDSGTFAASHHLSMGLSFESPAAARAAVAHYQAVASAVGWRPSADDVLYRGYCYVAETDQEAQEQAATSLFGRRETLETDADVSLREGPHGWDGSFFCGSPETVVEQIRFMRDCAGVGMVDLIFNDNRGWGAELPRDLAVRSLELFGTHVLPRVREL